jgi:hypothetical protein
MRRQTHTTSRSSRILVGTFCIAFFLSACAPIAKERVTQLPAVQAVGPTTPAALGTSNPAASYGGEVATRWFKLITQQVKRAPGFTPPVVARMYGYTGVALYEAIVAGMPGYQSLAGQLNEMPPMPRPSDGAQMNWPAVANSALATVARVLFPQITGGPLREFNLLEGQIHSELSATVSPEVLAQSEAYGRQVAEAVLQWSTGDGGSEGYLRNVDRGFVTTSDTGLWQPTPPDYLPPLQPSWGLNRTMALTAGNDCSPPEPPEYSTESSSRFYREALEVYETVRNLTDEQTEIARFWSDDAGATPTPPGHWVSVATEALANEEYNLAEASQLYARLGIALSDSFVACWNTKYTYNVLRPVTYIQELIDNEWGVQSAAGPVQTPPFPEYTSGHSVQSRAAAEVLTAYFGDSYRFTDITHVDLGFAPRTFASFQQAAAEAAISRLYGGIHYRSAIEEGLGQGACIGKRVMELQFEKP